jgi:hypothetical protein
MNRRAGTSLLYFWKPSAFRASVSGRGNLTVAKCPLATDPVWLSSHVGFECMLRGQGANAMILRPEYRLSLFALQPAGAAAAAAWLLPAAALAYLWQLVACSDAGLDLPRPEQEM